MKFESLLLSLLWRNVFSIPTRPIENNFEVDIRRMLRDSNGKTPVTKPLNRRAKLDNTFEDNISNLKPRDDNGFNQSDPFAQIRRDVPQTDQSGSDEVTLPLLLPGESLLNLTIETKTFSNDTKYGFAIVPGSDPTKPWKMVENVTYGALRKEISRAAPKDRAKGMRALVKAVLKQVPPFFEKRVKPGCQSRFKDLSLPPKCHKTQSKHIRHRDLSQRQDSFEADRAVRIQARNSSSSPSPSPPHGPAVTAIEAMRESVAKDVKGAKIRAGRMFSRFSLVLFTFLQVPVLDLFEAHRALIRGNGRWTQLWNEYRYAIDMFNVFGTIAIVLDRLMIVSDRIMREHFNTSGGYSVEVSLQGLLPLVNSLFDALVTAGKAFDRMLAGLAGPDSGSKGPQESHPEEGGGEQQKDDRCLNQEDLAMALPVMDSLELPWTWRAMEDRGKPEEQCPAEDPQETWEASDELKRSDAS